MADSFKKRIVQIILVFLCGILIGRFYEDLKQTEGFKNKLNRIASDLAAGRRSEGLEEVIEITQHTCPEPEGGRRSAQDTGHHVAVSNIPDPPATRRDVLFDKVKVLIWVATHQKNLNRQAKAVKQTWARRANKVLFMSSETSDFPTVEINVPDGREHLTAKTMKSFRYVYEHHFDDADWFMKADDDTFVVVENLRKFLEDKDPEEPHYFGHYFTWVTPGGYNSGGGGFVVSKEALRRFAKADFGAKCRQDGGFEDVEWGKCMHSLGVHPGDSRDKNQRTQFHGFSPDQFMIGDYPIWYPKADKWGGKYGIDSVSENAITFHHIPWPEIYLMEYYIYHLRPHGLKVMVDPNK